METNQRQIAKDIVNAWNSHNLERILSHYSDDFELTSPVIKEKLSIKDGTIKGKNNVREWWQRVLQKVPDIKFEFIDTAEGIDSFVLIQKSFYNNKITVSNFYLDAEGKIRKEIYFS